MSLSNENVIHKTKNGVEYLQFKRLLEYNNISHMYVLKNNLNFKMYDNIPGSKEELIESYKTVCGLEDMDYKNIVRATQEHTDNIKVVNEKISNEEPDMYIAELKAVDGLITNKSDIILSTTNADCILLLMYDPVKNVIANVHSGWKGTFQKISVKAVEKMKEEYGTKPEDVICAMVPSIGKCHFEVRSDVKNSCEEIFKYTGKLNDIISVGRIENGEQKYNIDTVLINEIILKDAGLKEENIISSNICSVCNSKYIHSRRAEGENYGVSTALISMK